MPVTIIAEAGVNHNGSLEMAKEMARVAKACGADIVKYQTAVPELVVSKFAQKAEYQKQTTDAAESQLEMIRRLHFSFDAHRELKEYCDSIGIQYLSAPFDLPSVRFLGTLGLPLLKIPSGEITNLPYLEAMAALKTPVLLSTGMSSLNEITDALAVLDEGGCPEATVLHCNTQYPTPYEDANLTAMLELFEQFGLPVGLSDHTPGWECDVAAAVLGAQVIEKHFTLDKSLPGPDQKASLDPTEFKAMVEAVRHVEAALGDGHKHLTEMQKVAGLEQPPVFCPVVDDYYKGMATTIQLHNRYLRGQPTAREICHILAAYYAGQPLVSVHWGGDAPTLPANALAGTDRLELVVCGHEEQTIVTALFDNLGKGASGAAVQNMNLMLGFEMTAGLTLETPPAGSPASARSERT